MSKIPKGAVCLAPGLASLIRLCCHHVIISAIHFKNNQDGAFWRDFKVFVSVLGPIHTKRKQKTAKNKQNDKHQRKSSLLLLLWLGVND